jgi:hypothetical protein
MTRPRHRGYDVSVKGGARRIELTARRGDVVLSIDVLARGFSRGRNTFASEVDIPRGEVFVDIWATEPRSSGRNRPPCAELPRWPDD